MASDEPVIKVQLSLESGPYNTSPVWVDITDYVEGFDTSLGRDSEIGSIEAGTMQMTLDNSDGRFTPGRVASPYYPNILPRRPIWVTADHTDEFSVTTTYDLFRGMVERWPATTEFGATHITIPCVDSLALIAKQKLEKPYIFELRKRSPLEIYPCDDDSTSFYYGMLDPANNRLHALPAATKDLHRNYGGGDAPVVKAKEPSILPNQTGLGSVSVRKTSDIDATINGDPYVISAGAPIVSDNRFTLDTTPQSPGWMISLYHQYVGKNIPGEEGADNSGYCLVTRVQPDHEAPMFAELLYMSNGTQGIQPYYELGYRGSDNPDGSASFNSFIDDSTKVYTSETKGNHVAFGFTPDMNGDGSMIPGIGYFVNGVGSYEEVPSDSEMLNRVVDVSLQIGSAYFPPRESFGDSGRYQLMSHDYNLEMVSVHAESWDAADVAAVRAAASGFPDQSVPDRLDMLLDQIGWPTSWRDFSTVDDGTRIKFLAWDSNPETLTELRSPVLDANGVLYVAPSGALTYRSRLERINPEPDFVFDSNAGTGVESPINFDMAEDDIVNVMDIDNAYGVKGTIRNEASVAMYEEASASATLRLSSDDEALDFARWRVERFGDAQLRADALRIFPSAHGTGGLWKAALGLDLSTVVQLANLPDTAPDQDLIYFVERIKHDVRRNGDRLIWQVEMQVSPATDREGWVLGDTKYGVLGSTTHLHY